MTVEGPIIPRMLTKQQAADYCCAGSLTRLDRWRRSGVIPNPPPGTNLFDRHAIDAALDKLSGIERALAPPEENPLEEWKRKRKERRAKNAKTERLRAR